MITTTQNRTRHHLMTKTLVQTTGRVFFQLDGRRCGIRFTIMGFGEPNESRLRRILVDYALMGKIKWSKNDLKELKACIGKRDVGYFLNEEVMPSNAWSLEEVSHEKQLWESPVFIFTDAAYRVDYRAR